MIKGLGKYTFQGAMIYLNSLLRSSILFAAEAMYNLKENEFRLLERIEENLLRKLFNTEKGCSIYQLYFESGHIPARFQIKRMKLVFYEYILKQEESTLIYRFLMAQKFEPRRGDWYSEIQTILKEFEIDISEKYIKQIKTSVFKNIVKQKSIESSMKYLKSRQMKGEKGAFINYNKLELQDYLNPCANISLEEQKLIF